MKKVSIPLVVALFATTLLASSALAESGPKQAVKAIRHIIKRDFKVDRAGKTSQLVVKWGDLKGTVAADATPTDWSGWISVTNARIVPQEKILFEGKDAIDREKSSQSKIAWTSAIGGHYDGLRFKITKNSDVADSDVSITFNNQTAPQIITTLAELQSGAKEGSVGDGYGYYLGLADDSKGRKELPQKNPLLLEITWGDLDNSRDEDTEEPKVEYAGSLSATGARLNVIKPVLFENTDSVTVEKGAEITWNSTIHGHRDGLLVKVLPATGDIGIADNALTERTLTLQLGDFKKSFSDLTQLGRFDIGNGYQVEVKNQFNVLPSVKTNVAHKYFEKKLELREKMTKIDDRVDALRRGKKFIGERVDRLKDLSEKINAYNFYGDSETEIGQEIDDLNEKLQKSDLSDVQLRLLLDTLDARFMNLKKKARTAKYEAQQIPFKDTDDNEWYTEFVDYVKNRNVVAGYVDEFGKPLGEYRPGNNVNVAEMLKIALRSAGHNESGATAKPDNVNAGKMWARNFFRLAENLGLSIVANPDDEPGRNITRGEVIRLVLEAFGVQPDPVDATGFSDVPADHEHAAYIEYARVMGIISGAGDTGTFLPDNPINRAEVAKIMRKAIELFGTQDETEIED